MKELDYSLIYDTASRVVVSLDLEIKQYITRQQLCLWATMVYCEYDHVKVITTRLLGEIDCSVIISRLRVSVIINDTGKASWFHEENIIRYEELDVDIRNLFLCLDRAFMQAEYK